MLLVNKCEIYKCLATGMVPMMVPLDAGSMLCSRGLGAVEVPDLL
jgi:hypothetical protein